MCTGYEERLYYCMYDCDLCFERYGHCPDRELINDKREQTEKPEKYHITNCYTCNNYDTCDLHY